MEKREEGPAGLFAAAPLELPPNMLSRDIVRVEFVLQAGGLTV